MSSTRTYFSPILAAIFVLCGLFTSAPVVRADELPYSDQIPLTSTNWNRTVSIPKFDPALGTLESVQVSISTMMTGTAGYENLDQGPRTVQLNVRARITIKRPDTTGVVEVQPTAVVIDPAAAFDKVIDYNGPSGGFFTDLQAADTQTNTLTAAADLTLFTGATGNPGSITLPVSAVGASNASGGGNLSLYFRTHASALVTVKYIYQKPTPTSTATSTPTNTSTATGTSTATVTNTPTLTPTPTNTATSTATNTATNTATPTATNSATSTATHTATNTPTATATPIPTGTATNTPTNTPTLTPTGTATATSTNTPTLTPTKTKVPLTACLGNRVFFDQNGNGIQNSTEPRLPGVSVTLWVDDNGDETPDRQITSTVTIDDGFYQFCNLTPGVRYIVQFIPPPGYALTLRDIGSDDEVDSDPSQTTGFTGIYILAPGEINNSADAGLVKLVNTPTSTATQTPTPTNSATKTPTPTHTATKLPTVTPTSTITPEPTVTPDVPVTPQPDQSSCTHSAAYWRSNPSEWPLTSLTIGGTNYNSSQLMTILTTPANGNATYRLAQQLIATKLNIANGSNPSRLGSTISGADSWLGFWGLGSNPPTGPAQEGLDYASTLEQFNRGELGPVQCPGDPQSNASGELGTIANTNTLVFLPLISRNGNR